MKLLKHNPFILILPVLIFSLGFVTLLSTSPERAKYQLLYFITGIVLYLLFSTIDYTIYKYYWKQLFTGMVVLLALTFVLGEIRLGSVRWINLGFFTLQPSEFAKIVLIIALTSFITSRPRIFERFKDIFIVLGIFLPIFLLVLFQPDLGTSIVYVAIIAGILFYAGLNKLYFLISIMIFGIFSSPIWQILHDYQKRRILVFLNPTLDIKGAGYNVIKSIIAIGSGGLFGKGFGRGTQSHLNFLPAHWTDFIFASFAEEWGFVGVFVLLTLFVLLLVAIFYIAHKSEEPFGSILTIGMLMVFFSQFVVNVGMNLGVMPVTGIPLPLVSYGGSSMLTSMILLGIVQNVRLKRTS